MLMLLSNPDIDKNHPATSRLKASSGLQFGLKSEIQQQPQLMLADSWREH